MKKYQRRYGFTLLETSLVLLIIAVLVAGVLIGRTMLASSRLQTAITDASNYIAAVGNFKQAYQSLPGDYADATTQWGTDSNGCPSGGGATGTCNGDGNGKIGGNCASGTYATSASNESFRAWQHLAAAKLYANTLGGVTSGGAAISAIGTNIPAASLEGAGFMLMWLDDPSLCSNIGGQLTSSGAYGNALVLAGKVSVVTTPSTSVTITPILTTEQAATIDSKMDDGVPATGVVRSFGSGTSGCTTTTDNTAAYALTTAGRKCATIFLMQY